MPSLNPTSKRLAPLALALAALVSCNGSSSGASINLRYQTFLSFTQQAAFEDARDRLEKIVNGGLGDALVQDASGKGIPCDSGTGPSTTIHETVHGLLILVSVSDLGTSILAQSGPCIVRTSNGLPIVATMTLNSNSAVDPGTRLGAVVQHEMFHALGFGTIWTDKSLVGANHTFTGQRALAAAKTANGAPSNWQSVPVVNTGDAGTIDSHWRKSVFQTELMTGWISAGSNPLSRTTIESMADLGYSVDDSQADPFTVPYPSAAALEEGAEPPLDMGDDVVHVPPVMVND